MLELGLVKVTDNTRLNLQVIPNNLSGFEMYEITTESNRIYIKPGSMTCPFCGRLGVKPIGNYFVCVPCIDQLKRRKKK